MNPELIPTAEKVALLLRTRTVGPSSGGLGGDTAPGDLTAFTDSTRPTEAEVLELVESSVDVIVGRLGGSNVIPVRSVGQVRHAIAIYTAMWVEASFFRDQATAESQAWWLRMLEDALVGVPEAIEDDGATTKPTFGTLTIGTTLTGATLADAEYVETLP